MIRGFLLISLLVVHCGPRRAWFSWTKRHGDSI